MSLAAVLPALTQIATPLVADALGDGVGSLGAGGMPGLDVRAAAAEAEMKDPAFWGPPEPEWEKAALAGLLGLVGGWIVARTMR
ncbi:MAG: hypothetical protein HS116_19325 [Planctomycetes bacterium]|nr:hypothetical protein [Planctomycetota bacterium]